MWAPVHSPNITSLISNPSLRQAQDKLAQDDILILISLNTPITVKMFQLFTNGI